MAPRRHFRLRLPTRTLQLGKRTLVMGVLNVTPDSFSDGGKFFDPERAIEQALAMERAGAHLLDIGGESTRPGSAGVSAKEELARVLPVLRALRGRLKIPVSIDTQKSEVAEAALDAGAQIINDISGLKSNPRIAEVAACRRVPLILMHMRGEPRTMCTPLKMLAVTVAAVPQMRSSGGTGLPSSAKVAPRKPLRDVPTRSGYPSFASCGSFCSNS